MMKIHPFIIAFEIQKSFNSKFKIQNFDSNFKKVYSKFQSINLNFREISIRNSKEFQSKFYRCQSEILEGKTFN